MTDKTGSDLPKRKGQSGDISRVDIKANEKMLADASLPSQQLKQEQAKGKSQEKTHDKTQDQKMQDLLKASQKTEQDPQKHLKQHPLEPKPWIKQGDINVAKGKRDDANLDYNQAWLLDRKIQDKSENRLTPEFWLKKADNNMELHRYKRANLDYNEAIRKARISHQDDLEKRAHLGSEAAKQAMKPHDQQNKTKAQQEKKPEKPLTEEEKAKQEKESAIKIAALTGTAAMVGAEQLKIMHKLAEMQLQTVRERELTALREKIERQFRKEAKEKWGQKPTKEQEHELQTMIEKQFRKEAKEDWQKKLIREPEDQLQKMIEAQFKPSIVKEDLASSVGSYVLGSALGPTTARAMNKSYPETVSLVGREALVWVPGLTAPIFQELQKDFSQENLGKTGTKAGTNLAIGYGAAAVLEGHPVVATTIGLIGALGYGAYQTFDPKFKDRNRDICLIAKKAADPKSNYYDLAHAAAIVAHGGAGKELYELGFNATTAGAGGLTRAGTKAAFSGLGKQTVKPEPVGSSASDTAAKATPKPVTQATSDSATQTSKVDIRTRDSYSTIKVESPKLSSPKLVIRDSQSVKLGNEKPVPPPGEHTTPPVTKSHIPENTLPPTDSTKARVLHKSGDHAAIETKNTIGVYNEKGHSLFVNKRTQEVWKIDPESGERIQIFPPGGTDAKGAKLTKASDPPATTKPPRTEPEGLHRTVMPDGRIITKYPDGTIVDKIPGTSTHPEQTIVTSPHGTEMKVQRDLSWKERTPSGDLRTHSGGLKGSWSNERATPKRVPQSEKQVLHETDKYRVTENKRYIVSENKETGAQRIVTKHNQKTVDFGKSGKRTEPFSKPSTDGTTSPQSGTKPSGSSDKPSA